MSQIAEILKRLDDLEASQGALVKPVATNRGIWAPVVADAFSGGNEASVTFTAADQKWARIGNRVWVDCSLTDIDTTGMTAGNSLFVRELPFVSAANTVTTGPVMVDDFTLGGLYAITEIGAEDSWVTFKVIVESGAATALLVSMIDDATNSLRFSICYDV